MKSMALSDAVLGNLTTIYVAVIAAIKAYGLVTGRSFGAGFVLVVSTAAVGAVLVGTLVWDVSRRATDAVARYNREISFTGGGGGVGVDLSHRRHHHDGGICRGGICWHGVAVRSPASQVRFRLPPHIQYGAF